MCAAVAGMVLMFWSPGPAADAGTDPDTSGAGVRLVLITDIDSARVYLDTLYAGVTPLAVDTLRPGTYRLRLLPPHTESWLAHAVDDTVSVSAGDTLTLRYTLREFLAVRSQPSGAMVYLGDSLVGESPGLVPADLLLPGRRLSLKKDGFEPFEVATAELKGSILQTLLKPGWQTPPGEDSPYVSALPGWSPRRIGLYVSGGTSVLAGVAAAYFKIAADDRQAAFLETRDPAILSERKRLDTWAGITFAVTQAALAVFSYLLISE